MQVLPDGVTSQSLLSAIQGGTSVVSSLDLFFNLRENKLAVCLYFLTGVAIDVRLPVLWHLLFFCSVALHITELQGAFTVTSFEPNYIIP